MKQSEFRIFYLAFATLYGAIYSEEAFLIMRKFFPNLTKKEMYADIKNRSDKLTVGYWIYKCPKGKYVIGRDYYTSEELDKLFQKHTDKPFYVPKSFEDFKKYKDGSYWWEENKTLIAKMTRFLDKHTLKRNDFNYPLVLLMIIHDSISECVDLQEIVDCLEQRGTVFGDINEINKFAGLYQELNNHTRFITNCGFTPEELAAFYGPPDMNNIQMTIGPNMRENFYSGESNPQEYLDGLSKSDLPDSIKKSFGDELRKIISDLEKKKTKQS